jgi:hypothetical protein
MRLLPQRAAERDQQAPFAQEGDIPPAWMEQLRLPTGTYLKIEDGSRSAMEGTEITLSIDFAKSHLKAFEGMCRKAEKLF